MSDNEEPKELTVIQSNFLDVFEDQMGSVGKAAKALGIHRATFYRWCDESEPGATRVSEIRELLIDRSESALHRAIESNSVPAIIFHLKTKGRDRGYVERAPQDETAETADELRARMERGKANVKALSEGESA